MQFLTNYYFFPFFQMVLVALTLFAVFKDRYRPAQTGGMSVKLTVTRSEASMALLQKVTGLALGAIVTVINKSVFEQEKIYAAYSAAFNALDLVCIAYLCYISGWGRNFIIGASNRLQQEAR
jgi:hypothetical protein